MDNIEEKHLLEVYLKPEISIIELELENTILNSSNPDGTIPDMPWGKASFME